MAYDMYHVPLCVLCLVNAGTNKAASSGTSLNTKALDDDTENLTHERVTTELKKAIMQARTEKKLTVSTCSNYQ
ncbi:unnamed protein product [Microthlaspi erraticum]|uniref:Uncharacterized protein n=1 Tax=Microthlaspi erraticum TaxID=1685480 RepID=A0A6D2HH18_9BRAS|nr:unnamed protein product [Microthlaspi erraticum]